MTNTSKTTYNKYIKLLNKIKKYTNQSIKHTYLCKYNGTSESQFYCGIWQAELPVWEFHVNFYASHIVSQDSYLRYIE